MPVRTIRLFPDRVLSLPCKTVQNFNNELQSLIEDLFLTLKKSPGVGLAAPQVGAEFRVSVVDISKSKKFCRDPSTTNHGPIVLINPILLHGTGVQIPREGCLSVPDLLANVRRYNEVTVRTQKWGGEELILNAKGFEALAFQHEMDHLNGKLFLDRVVNLKTDIFRRKSY